MSNYFQPNPEILKNITVLHYDETESGPRLRKTLEEKHGIECRLECKDVGEASPSAFGVDVDLYSYDRPSNGETMWFIETQSFSPPDVVIFRSWVIATRPTPEQVRELVTMAHHPDLYDESYE